MASRSSPVLLLGLCTLLACGPGSPSGDGTAGATTGGPTSGGPGTGTTSEPEPTSTTNGASTAGTSTTGSSAAESSTTELPPATTTTTTTGGSSTEAIDTGDESSSGTTDTGGPKLCQEPAGCVPFLFEDGNNQPTNIESGWLLCDGGIYHREQAIDCAHEVFWPKCEGQDGECSTDAQCPGNEACVNIYGTCSCTGQCMSDKDCSGGEICMCAAQVPGMASLTIMNECEPADCATKADCEGNCGCRGDMFFCGTLEGAFCPTANDQCKDNDDCRPGIEYCGWDSDEERWMCQEVGICE